MKRNSDRRVPMMNEADLQQPDFDRTEGRPLKSTEPGITPSSRSGISASGNSSPVTVLIAILSLLIAALKRCGIYPWRVVCMIVLWAQSFRYFQFEVRIAQSFSSHFCSTSCFHHLFNFQKVN